MPQIQEQYNCPIKLTMDLIGGKRLQEIFTQMCQWGNEYALDHSIIINCGKS